jgi:hypothetical protein
MRKWSLMLAVVLGLFMFSSFAIAGDQQAWVECAEWHTVIEKYLCGTTPIFDSKGNQIGTKPMYCEREKKKCKRWNIEPPTKNTGPARGEAEPNIMLAKAEEIVLNLQQNCVCAYCNKPCGSGHESWCIYKPKAKPPIANDLVTLNINTGLSANCIEKDLQCTLNGTPCCAPYSCKGKFPNTYCQ